MAEDSDQQDELPPETDGEQEEIAQEDALLQACTNCAAMLDVSDLEPFAKVHCPICGTAIRARTQLKNFTLVEVLGAGGMGAVYKALDTHLDRMVALKVVRKEYSSDATYLAKFEREARITASVNHPNVVKVYSFGSDHGLFYIAMELVDKGSLDDLMNLQGSVAEVQALGVGIQVAQGLQAAHQKGLIHRDVKPGNILFADAQTAKIVDFGLALLAEHEAEERGEVWGTPYYVAPEKLDHQPEDFRSDMYSLGGTLFHAISGRPPFEADNASLVALKHLKSKAVSLQAFAPDVSSATAYVINRTLHKDPTQRYQSYAELIEHLEYARAQLIGGAGGPRKPKERVVVEGAQQQRALGIIALVMILVLVGIGCGVYEFRDTIFGRDSGQPAAAAVENSEEAEARQQFDAARKQLVAGDYAGAQDAFRKLDESDLTQPLQNLVTINEGLISLLEENDSDARGWFKVVHDRSHFSNDPGDRGLVNFFGNIGTILSGGAPVSPATGDKYSLDNIEALAPLLFGMKDWALGHFEDAGRLLALYLSSTPAAPYQWVADYKPLAQKYADQEGAYEKAAAAAASAKTAEERTDALKQIQDLKGHVKGKMAAELAKMARGLQKKSASTAAASDTRIAASDQQRDEDLIFAARLKYAALCADFRFDEARAAVDAAVVNTPVAAREKEILLKKADWLRQFKAQLIADLNTYGYTDPIVNRAGTTLPNGTKKATDAALIIETPFGAVPCPWNTLSPAVLLTMGNHFWQSMAVSAPAQSVARQWLSGVFACEEGLPHDGRVLLVQASLGSAEYKGMLNLFPGN